jgi:hypothetical protein
MTHGAFNTGRLYGPKGQRIWYFQREDGWLFFKDCDRLISGWIDNSGPEPQEPTPMMIMVHYDTHAYYQPSERGAPDWMETPHANPHAEFTQLRL